MNEYAVGFGVLGMIAFLILGANLPLFEIITDKLHEKSMVAEAAFIIEAILWVLIGSAIGFIIFTAKAFKRN